MSRLAVEDEKRMVHMLTVIAMVEGAFLLSVNRIVGRVEVQKHLLGCAALLSLSEVEFKERLGYLMAGASVG